MSVSSSAAAPTSGGGIVMGGSAQLPRHPVYRTCDLDAAQRHMSGVFDRHGVTYLPRQRRLDFRHRQANLGSITVNSLQWGAGVMVDAPQLRDFYLLQFTLEGECELWQQSHYNLLPARSVAIVNPGRPFRKAWMPRSRQLLLRIDSGLVEREFRTWTAGDESGCIEFDIPPIFDLAKVGTLARYVRMLCDDLKSGTSDLSHPLVADRVASGLVSLLLASMPHNKSHAIDKAGKATAPFFVRRAEQFIEEHACDAIALGDLTGVAGVSARALQTGFRRFRDTTPMAYLRSIRLELARTELAKAGQQRGSVATVANAFGFGHLGRFARDYERRFGELPSQTLCRGGTGEVR